MLGLSIVLVVMTVESRAAIDAEIARLPPHQICRRLFCHYGKWDDRLAERGQMPCSERRIYIRKIRHWWDLADDVTNKNYNNTPGILLEKLEEMRRLIGDEDWYAGNWPGP